MSVPIIDISAFAPDGDHQSRVSTSKALRQAFTDVGFCYVRGHGCPESVVSDAFAVLNRFFDLPPREKAAVDAKKSPLYRGYNSVEEGAHSCTPEEEGRDEGGGDGRDGIALRDLKESFTIGAGDAKNREKGKGAATGAAETSKVSPSSSPMHGPNQWPDEEKCPGFRRAMEAHWGALLHCTAVRLMKAMAMSLDIEDLDFFCDKCDDPVAQMVLLRYPPNPGADDDYGADGREEAQQQEGCSAGSEGTTTAACCIPRGRRGCGAHTDCGFLTILAQDEVAGLEVRRSDGTWTSAPPMPGTFVVNLGDMAARWTNDRYRSTEHRVYNKSRSRARHSIPFFINCNYDTLVECIGSCKDEAGLRYEPVVAGEYILEKLGLMYMLEEASKKESRN